MAAINPDNTMNFVPADAVLDEVTTDLSSFNVSGLLDPGAFYNYIAFVLHNLGAAVEDEIEGIVYIDHYMGRMPDNFIRLWDAYKVKPSHGSGANLQIVHPQNGFVFYTDTSSLTLKKPCGYDICVPDCVDYTTRITVRDYLVQTQPACSHDFCLPELLAFGMTPESMLYDKHSPCLHSNNRNRINITKKTISATFDCGWVLLRYFGIAIDPKTSLPMIPDNPNIERALVYDIEYRVLRKLYLNNTVGDLERRLQTVEANAVDTFQNALNEVKTPSFKTMLKAAQMNRNRFRVFQIRRTDRLHSYPH